MSSRATSDPVRLEHRGCPLGCAQADRPLLVGRDRLLGLPGRFRVVQCRGCGLARTDPRPTRECIGRYYPEDYHWAPIPGERRRLPPILRALRDALSDAHGTATPPQPPGRLLEVGCGMGTYLHEMAGRGWAVEGIEPSPTASDAARGLGYRVQAGGVETAEPPGHAVDLVVAWFVLEHLHDPLAALRRLRGWVRPGGWLAASVPDLASLDYRLFRSRWYSLHLPHHLFHYTPATLRRVVGEAGWQVERVFHQRNVLNLAGSLGLVLEGDLGRGHPLARPFLACCEGSRWNYVLAPLARFLAHYGHTGRMCIWARRP